MELNIKRFCPNAPEPRRLTDGSVGYDLPVCATRYDHAKFMDVFGNVIEPNHENAIVIPLGWGFEIPPKHEGRVEPRSSTRHWLLDGVIDWDYRGQVFVKTTTNLVLNANPKFYLFDRIAQITFREVVIFDKLNVVESLTPTARSTGGNGSTGR